MGVNINLHRVVEVKIEKIDELESPSAYRDEKVFFTRDIVIVQDDGTELTLDLFSNKHSNLIPVFNTEED
jgi:hypothetical protein